jgi:hypothetical protein
MKLPTGKSRRNLRLLVLLSAVILLCAAAFLGWSSVDGNSPDSASPSASDAGAPTGTSAPGMGALAQDPETPTSASPVVGADDAVPSGTAQEAQSDVWAVVDLSEHADSPDPIAVIDLRGHFDPDDSPMDSFDARDPQADHEPFSVIDARDPTR